MRALLPLLLLLLPVAGLAEQAAARGASTASAHSCAVDGIAVGGYDLVSYHQSEGPRRGSTDFAYEHGGLTYLFSNRDNLETFLADTQKYLPTYQGWCAATLAMGRLACPDYTNFKIENGKLLLFELAGFTNGRSLWNSDPLGFRERADNNFIRLVQ